jgi:hypothetical protein
VSSTGYWEQILVLKIFWLDSFWLTSRCSLHRGVDIKYKELYEFLKNIKTLLEYH